MKLHFFVIESMNQSDSDQQTVLVTCFSFGDLMGKSDDPENL